MLDFIPLPGATRAAPTVPPPLASADEPIQPSWTLLRRLLPYYREGLPSWAATPNLACFLMPARRAELKDNIDQIQEHILYRGTNSIIDITVEDDDVDNDGDE
ncbi:MAG TPA: hypothetical protein PLJ20_10065 [Candidatus Contendobacter sp.]|nr:hypothetical protein [Candidatus Contendobacter sp.]